MNGPYIKLVLSAFLSIALGAAAFALGDYQAKRTNDLDGEASMLGFVLLLAFIGLGVSCLIAAVALWFLTLGDRYDDNFPDRRSQSKDLR
jgi:hypothetical protein